MKKLYYIFIICAFVLFIKNANCQSTPEALWSITYPGIYSDVSRHLTATADGGFAIVGESDSYGPGIISTLLLKCNSDGNIEWQKTYGGSSFDLPMAVTQTSDGGFAIATYSNSFAPSGMNLRIIKTDALGDTLWTSVLPESNGISLQVRACLIETPDGGYLTAGNIWSPPNANQIILFKLNNSGEVVWNKEFGGFSDDYGATIQETADGNFILGGYTYSYGSGKCDGYMIKITPDGEEIWNSVVGGSDYDSYRFIRAISDGYIGVGTAQSYGDAEQGFIVKLNEDGSLAWEKAFGGSSNETFEGVIETVNHEYIVTGHTSSYGSGAHDFLIMRISRQGELLGMDTFGGADEEFGINVEAIPGIGYIAGGSFSGSSLDLHAILFEEDTLTTPVSYKNIGPSFISFTNVSPNPFTENASVNFTTKEPTNIKITIIEIEGQEVSTVFNGKLNAGDHSIQLDDKSIKPGVYFINIHSPYQTVMRKFIKVAN